MGVAALTNNQYASSIQGDLRRWQQRNDSKGKGLFMGKLIDYPKPY